MDQIVLFGDSITQHSSSQDAGFAFKAAVENEYIRRLDVINRGFSGYNTKQALQVLDKILPKPECARIRLFTIFFGANDARLPNTPGPSQTVSVEDYLDNLRKIATHPALLAHEPQIILITPPPIEERLCEITDEAKGIKVVRRTVDNTFRYAAAVRNLGRELRLPVLDIWDRFMTLAGYRIGGPLIGAKSVPQSKVFTSLMHDGLHFTPYGYKILFQEFMRLIDRDLPHLSPDKIPFVLPLWDDQAVWLE